ncbi:MAG: metallophosphoesterase [Candidatus Kapaibacteriota bacterium]
MNEKVDYQLKKLYDNSLKISISDNDRFVIFSDLHMGNGGANDDFLKNAYLFDYVLNNYYLPRSYKLILNGDVEELYKFSIKSIEKKWKNVYNTFDLFSEQTGLYKIVGNHDHLLYSLNNLTHNYPLLESLKLDYNGNDIFIYHGHQTANIFEQYSMMVHYSVKYLFRTVGNNSIPIVNSKKFETEKIAYEFAKKHQIISILGHTHRPLFESLSKIDSLKFNLEQLINLYYKTTNGIREELARKIEYIKNELITATKINYSLNSVGSVYNDEILVPCLFNSGAVTGKRGITALEIKNGKIKLVYWFDLNRSQRYLEDYRNVQTRHIPNTNFYKAILRKTRLDYIFTRIKVLT